MIPQTAWIMGQSRARETPPLAGNKNIKPNSGGTAMKKHKPIRTADGTYLLLGQQDEFQKFFKGLIGYLQKKLKKVENGGNGGHYYTCGQPHERFSQNWKQFPHLWNYTDKKGLDFYAVKDLLDEFFYRELECDCDILPSVVIRK